MLLQEKKENVSNIFNNFNPNAICVYFHNTTKHQINQVCMQEKDIKVRGLLKGVELLSTLRVEYQLDERLGSEYCNSNLNLHSS